MVPKFRVWDETQHKMLQVDCIDFIDGKAYWVEASPADGNVQGGNDGPIGDNRLLKLEQYTGLKDANGDDIYENDLVSLDPDDAPYQVIFDEGKFELDNDYLGIVYDLSETHMDCDIVGNVHTNPELLEAQHDTRTD
ncbi:YopX family protein [Levilactobacillus mulengensis]|uniref:YopX family protein n=1 Tax=Levilactobacillus mulengensis TaxID=2486025 RepID=UPI001CDB59C1|nr:YopX family protein [Levilactobacillus mulengensis]